MFKKQQGYFVQDTTYRLVDIDQSGWTLICQNSTTCHYVDPDCLQESSSTLGSWAFPKMILVRTH
ncbi:hypothetical protein D0962_02075 [Leptolyngbyaceae cyanobacterium CCMR0082]|nr:hypothetical protein [Adonisia turfae]NEZ61573.1 hypothetical protein [Adonisia turfae CCMR0082]